VLELVHSSSSIVHAHLLALYFRFRGISEEEEGEDAGKRILRPVQARAT
jgi:hypothetical protein